ncbi:MAG: nicotinate-nucleotide--dimethylbenzimidazole phosphoribosyltransferase [Tannerella sp.]|jgi:nicotinate-nucleotide--dimethylbenzimidazole phosphoribosyltransferase|nr:nicotinate-nucleotide--dimethylbenzimidazole phosphoribosyltransferase [Tannerella sp.]
MKHFQIYNPEEKIKEKLQHKIDNLTKPKGSLGRLEEVALQVGFIQQTLTPKLNNPHNVIFAADHGITDENVSVSPKEVTWQQCIHFLKSNGGGINFLCRQHGFILKVVDAGVDYDFPSDIGIVDMKIRKGTRNYVHEAAMTTEEMELCIDRGAAVVRKINEAGCNIISFGEMGIGNTSSSSLWMTCLTNIPLLQCVGAGAGLNNEGVRHKYQVLKKALDNYHGDRSVNDIMRYFGGYEMVMAVGGMLQAAELNMIILIDGFIMTNCILAASHLYPEVLSYAVFGHCGDEAGHSLLLEALNARPLLNLGMRLGEGTGAICAFPILDSAVRMINEMNSFEGGKVTKYF